MARILGILGVVGLLVVTAAIGGTGVRPAYALDCDNFLVQSAAQTTLRALGEDKGQLDGANDNGVACEQLPCPCDTDPIAGLIGDYVPPTATATNTPDPTQPASSSDPATATPVPTSTPITNAIAAATATSAAATATSGASIVAPTNTIAPLPATQNVITPPSTGSAGLR